jgi:hypothetical protein
MGWRDYGAVGVLRLRECFASQNTRCAQDDKETYDYVMVIGIIM